MQTHTTFLLQNNSAGTTEFILKFKKKFQQTKTEGMASN